MAKLLYQGHGSFRLQCADGTVVYIDPFAGEGYDLPADGVLVSHEHFDHNQVDKVTLKEGGRVWRAADLLQNGHYGQAEIGEVNVMAVPACNKNHPIEECVGFVMYADYKTLYFAGDTSTTECMPALRMEKLDYVFLPCDGVYNMDVEEASRCAEIINAKHSVPVHMAPGALFSQEVADQFTGPNKLVLKPGEEIDF